MRGEAEPAGVADRAGHPARVQPAVTDIRVDPECEVGVAPERGDLVPRHSP
jgi:hypothetical protein